MTPKTHENTAVQLVRDLAAQSSPADALRDCSPELVNAIKTFHPQLASVAPADAGEEILRIASQIKFAEQVDKYKHEHTD